ncbi:aa3-type cytochrome oxidase subunit IV [Corynebacterium otitidis]|uniref:Cytochrome c oxidase polypeptide 4 n=1 Tax=Corynebacterium otitidis ATCC 51513 TaxID=883169 RepID=I7LBC0_9CORY|nr:cytochrome c oxidase subunit 4 [Corynebacterium otitidis]EJZ82791.1 hypothetical protein HMPREF9719_00283 [Corynebacterium otitidis ATCC 51513]KKO84472.1 cytochrome C oxidase [Corynebacterium otitidis]CCI82989.1 putative membrane protein [Corynebacterium otitidis ATCC 51513]
MKSSSKIMFGLTTFLGLIAVVYIIATVMVRDDAYLQGAEWAGIVGLVLSAGLTAMLGGYIHITEKRTDILPEDWEEAEVEDKAGVLGFFSASSIWPFLMSVAVLVLGLGVIYLHWWLIVFGAAFLVFTVVMLNMQYNIPQEKH